MYEYRLNLPIITCSRPLKTYQTISQDKLDLVSSHVNNLLEPAGDKHTSSIHVDNKTSHYFTYPPDIYMYMY